MNEQATFISELVGRLTSLDPANLIVLGTIAFGYILHFCFTKIPKHHVPIYTAVFTLVLYPIIAWKDGQGFRKLVMDVILAMIFWVVAWAVHKFVLLPLRAKLKRKTADIDAGDDDAHDQLPK